MNEIKLYHGDCLEVMEQIPDNSIDCVVADLPYGVTRNPWDIKINLTDLWRQYNRVCKPEAAIVLHCQQPFTTELINSNLKYFKYLWYWYKHIATGFLNAYKQPLRNVEEIAVFYRKQCVYNPHMRKGKMRYKGGGGRQTSNYGKFGDVSPKNDIYFPTTLLDITNCNQALKEGHATGKPVELEKYLIETYCNENFWVLDNVMGCGTTGVAALQVHCNFIGIEKDETFFQRAKERIEKERGKQE